MKFERLKKDSRKKWLIGVCIIVVMVTTIMFVGTRAKYRNTQRIDLVDGTINWKPYDLNMVAIKLQNESGTYDNSDTVPTSGYTLSDKSYCEVNGTKDTLIPMEYKNGKVNIGVTKKGTRCYLYFDKKVSAGNTILAGKTIDISRANGITGILSENTTGRIFKAQDDDGDTYFFAGTVDNNWVQFGGFYWRIIRINGDGTIRMIYSGVANGNVSDANKTGTTTQISNDGGTTTIYVFNPKHKDNAYIGYMYGATGQSGENGYANTHKNTNSSIVKTQVDTWYNTNLNKTGVKEYVDTNAGFCEDRKVYIGSSWNGYGTLGYGIYETTYEPASRFLKWSNGEDSWNSIQTPTFKCSQSNDLYTISEANKGNKALTYPIGLITSDEVVFAGGFGGKGNNFYYLNTDQHYWTMSPYRFSSSATMFIVDLSGSLSTNGVNYSVGTRPVINLRADIQLTGTGTTTDPFIVVGAQ